jgi:hypothetical protein
VLVEGDGVGRLLDPPLVHDDHPVGHGHGLDLVVGDVDDGGGEPSVQGLDLGAHLDPELGVEVGEGLVEEEDVGLADDGAANGDALALAAREVLGPAVEIGADVEDLGRLLHRRLDLGLGHASDAHAVADIVAHGHVRVEGVVSERPWSSCAGPAGAR